ncbi:uncharacterized protein LOC124943166 [Impatiens glandulifera]|uniref:uncharacterized protein LOC124943166 n=1 Tax=Impatiens glandulifera TaxID=253017 RepID=UPI001FB15991|nr:uncharacterized protein LOC124943166 [Impatiens glandulifera]
MTNFSERFFYVISREIFSWMPAKSILKLASTSHHCLSFIQEESFCKQQDRNMRSMDDCGLFIQGNAFNYDKYMTKILALPSQNLSYMGVQPHSMKFLSDNVQLITSSGGLFFGRTTVTQSPYVETFVILNPVTGMIAKVPKPLGLVNYANMKVVFNYSDNGDLLLMIIMMENDDWISLDKCMVYSHEDMMWKEKSDQRHNLGGRSLCTEKHVFLDNCVYFLSDLSCYFGRENENYFPYIVSYNTNNEETRFLGLPKRSHKGRNHYTCRMNIFSWNKGKTMCLVKLRKGLFTIWVLNDIKKGDSWIRILRKTLFEIGLQEHGISEVADFKVINGKTLIVAMENNNVYSYNILGDDDQEKNLTMISNGHGCNSVNLMLYSYTNTLRRIPNGIPLIDFQKNLGFME